MTSNPSPSSVQSILLLVSRGLSSAVHKAPVDMPANVMLMFAILIAPKKVIQCTAINTPQSHINRRSLELALNDFLLNSKYKPIATEVIAVRLKTSAKASMEMNFPSMAVNPHTNTIK
nr:hypothetical protein [uncultured bacterium]